MTETQGNFWIELAFTVPKPAAELWADVLIEAGASGVEERDDETIARPEAGLGTLVVWVQNPDEYLDRVRDWSSGLPEARVQQRERDEDEWRDAWKKYFTPRPIGQFVIVPSWEGYVGLREQIQIKMDPGRAFGTGGHASTRLCLRRLSEMDPPRIVQFLDVGCGCGVLAIAMALKWREAHGIGTDVDPEAVQVSKENAQRNGVGDRIMFFDAPLSRVGPSGEAGGAERSDTIEGRFDVVTANIQPEVLIPMAPDLASRTAGELILSGILLEAAASVESAYLRQEMELFERTDEEGWCVLSFRHRR